MCICIHVFVHVFYICDICTHFIYADFILLLYLWLLGQRWPNKEVQTNNIMIADLKRQTTRDLQCMYLIIIPVVHNQSMWRNCSSNTKYNAWQERLIFHNRLIWKVTADGIRMSYPNAIGDHSQDVNYVQSRNLYEILSWHHVVYTPWYINTLLFSFVVPRLN